MSNAPNYWVALEQLEQRVRSDDFFARAFADELAAIDAGREARQTIAITPGQMRALHAKLSAICGLDTPRRERMRGEILEQVSEKFGRTITSTTDLTSAEASFALDLLSNGGGGGGP